MSGSSTSGNGQYPVDYSLLPSAADMVLNQRQSSGGAPPQLFLAGGQQGYMYNGNTYYPQAGMANAYMGAGQAGNGAGAQASVPEADIIAAQQAAQAAMASKMAQKREQVARACQRCASGKRKCSGTFPCERCVRLGSGDSCVEVTIKRKVPPTVTGLGALPEAGDLDQMMAAYGTDPSGGVRQASNVTIGEDGVPVVTRADGATRRVLTGDKRRAPIRSRMSRDGLASGGGGGYGGGGSLGSGMMYGASGILYNPDGSVAVLPLDPRGAAAAASISSEFPSASTGEVEMEAAQAAAAALAGVGAAPSGAQGLGAYASYAQGMYGSGQQQQQQQQGYFSMPQQHASASSSAAGAYGPGGSMQAHAAAQRYAMMMQQPGSGQAQQYQQQRPLASSPTSASGSSTSGAAAASSSAGPGGATGLGLGPMFHGNGGSGPSLSGASPSLDPPSLAAGGGIGGGGSIGSNLLHMAMAGGHAHAGMVAGRGVAPPVGPGSSSGGGSGSMLGAGGPTHGGVFSSLPPSLYQALPDSDDFEGMRGSKARRLNPPGERPSLSVPQALMASLAAGSAGGVGGGGLGLPSPGGSAAAIALMQQQQQQLLQGAGASLPSSRGSSRNDPLAGVDLLLKASGQEPGAGGAGGGGGGLISPLTSVDQPLSALSSTHSAGGTAAAMVAFGAQISLLAPGTPYPPLPPQANVPSSPPSLGISGDTDIDSLVPYPAWKVTFGDVVPPDPATLTPAQRARVWCPTTGALLSHSQGCMGTPCAAGGPEHVAANAPGAELFALAPEEVPFLALRGGVGGAIPLGRQLLWLHPEEVLPRAQLCAAVRARQGPYFEWAGRYLRSAVVKDPLGRPYRTFILLRATERVFLSYYPSSRSVRHMLSIFTLVTDSGERLTEGSVLSHMGACLPVPVSVAASCGGVAPPGSIGGPAMAQDDTPSAAVAPARPAISSVHSLAMAPARPAISSVHSLAPPRDHQPAAPGIGGGGGAGPRELYRAHADSDVSYLRSASFLSDGGGVGRGAAPVPSSATAAVAAALPTGTTSLIGGAVGFPVHVATSSGHAAATRNPGAHGGSFMMNGGPLDSPPSSALQVMQSHGARASFTSGSGSFLLPQQALPSVGGPGGAGGAAPGAVGLRFSIGSGDFYAGGSAAAMAMAQAADAAVEAVTGGAPGVATPAGAGPAGGGGAMFFPGEDKRRSGSNASMTL